MGMRCPRCGEYTIEEHENCPSCNGPLHESDTIQQTFNLSKNTCRKLVRGKKEYEEKYWHGNVVEWDTYLFWLACY